MRCHPIRPRARLKSSQSRAWHALLCALLLLPVGLLGGVGGSPIFLHACDGLGVHLHAREDALSSGHHGHAHGSIPGVQARIEHDAASEHGHGHAHARERAHERPGGHEAEHQGCVPGCCGTMGVLVTVPNLQRHAGAGVDSGPVCAAPAPRPFRIAIVAVATRDTSGQRLRTGPPPGRASGSAIERLLRVGCALLI